MFNFDMSIEQNAASFKSSDGNSYVFVDSFDNREFNVRTGTLSESFSTGAITASTTEELNSKLTELMENRE